jgi:hypothetical protein
MIIILSLGSKKFLPKKQTGENFGKTGTWPRGRDGRMYSFKRKGHCGCSS